MTEYELGLILQEHYKNAPNGYKVAAIHYFGLQYAAVIKDNNLSISNITTAAKIPNSYNVEISKMLKLKEYLLMNKGSFMVIDNV